STVPAAAPPTHHSPLSLHDALPISARTHPRTHMDCSVIAISRTLGAGGEDLGHLMASELGFRYVDAEIITNAAQQAGVSRETLEDRKSTRLNSSHVSISYAVFCLKK